MNQPIRSQTPDRFEARRRALETHRRDEARRRQIALEFLSSHPGPVSLEHILAHAQPIPGGADDMRQTLVGLALERRVLAQPVGVHLYVRRVAGPRREVRRV